MTGAPTGQFLAVTELPGEEISREQLDRLKHRYHWSADYVRGKDVLEVACGGGPGLRYLASIARSIKAGDYSSEVLRRAQSHIGSEIELKVFDAQAIPYPDASFDTVIIFEALYYIPAAEKFFAEAKRILRPGGFLLITSANKDLYDFNPSPHSTVYYGVAELNNVLARWGFSSEFFGYLRVSDISLRQKVLRPVKKAAVALNLLPKTMTGKKLLKRMVFGSMVPMPNAIGEGGAGYAPPERIDAQQPDRTHKVLYCAARRS